MAIRSPKWLVLVGATRSERSTLRTELVHELLESGRDATHFSWEINYDPAARERELLAEFELEHHRPPRLNSSG